MPLAIEKVVVGLGSSLLVMLALAAVVAAADGDTEHSIATATVRIVTDPAEPDAAFAIELNGDPVPVAGAEPIRVQGQAGSAFTASLVDPGPRYELVGIDCRLLERDGAPAYTADVVGASVTFTFEPGDVVDCAFELEARSATVVATVATDPPQSEGKVDIDMDGATVALEDGEFATDEHAAPGRYHVTMLPSLEFALVDISCRDALGRSASFEGDATTETIRLSPEADSATTCTFVVESRVATVSATIDAGAESVETEFTLELAGQPKTLYAGDIVTDEDARADLYRMALLPDPGFRLLDIVCLDLEREPDEQRISAEITFENQSIAFAPGIGRQVDCTFVVAIAGGGSALATAPKSGNWRVVNEAGTIQCGGFTQDLPRTTDKGRMKVKQGGRRLITTGIGDGPRSRIVFEHDDSDPGMWTGSIQVRQQGVRVTLNYVMAFENEKRLDGSMSARFKAAGRSCVLRRGFKLTHAGK